MSEAPESLKYTENHEWVKVLEDGTVEIGITEHAQDSLGDLVFVELPEVDSEHSAGEECAVVESVKAASDVYCPVSGKIVEVNEILSDAPETVNQDPYGEGWLFRIQPTEELDESRFLSADAYAELAESEGD